MVAQSVYWYTSLTSSAKHPCCTTLARIRHHSCLSALPCLRCLATVLLSWAKRHWVMPLQPLPHCPARQHAQMPSRLQMQFQLQALPAAAVSWDAPAWASALALQLQARPGARRAQPLRQLSALRLPCAGGLACACCWWCLMSLLSRQSPALPPGPCACCSRQELKAAAGPPQAQAPSLTAPGLPPLAEPGLQVVRLPARAIARPAKQTVSLLPVVSETPRAGERRGQTQC